jgi:hypothetical protein
MSIWNIYLPEISDAFREESMDGIWSRIKNIPASPDHISSSIANQVKQGFPADMVKAAFACFSLYATGAAIVQAQKNGKWDMAYTTCKQACDWDSSEQNRKLLGLVQAASRKQNPDLQARHELLTKVAPLLKAHLEKTSSEIDAADSNANLHMKIAGKRPNLS